MTDAERARVMPPDRPVAQAAVDVVLIGAAGVMDPSFLPALHALETRGRLRVRILMGASAAAATLLRHSFPDAAVTDAFTGAKVGRDALAIVGSPPHLHPAQVTSAFRRGWHILMVSPLARRTAEAQAMSELARRHGRLLAVCRPRRFTPALGFIRGLARDHLLGPTIRFDIHEGVPAAGTSSGPPPEGVLTDIGIGVLDLLVWWFEGGTVERYADDAMGGVEANAIAHLQFAENVHGRVHLSRDWPTTQSYEVVFERGVVRWQSGRPERLLLQLASAPAALDALVVSRTAPGADPDTPAAGTSALDTFVAQIEAVLDAIVANTGLDAPANDAMAALRLADECRRQRTLLALPWLSRNEAAHARVLSVPQEA